MAWFKLWQWLPCLFCGVQRATQHRLCEICWQQLPWDQQLQTRHGITFTASCYYQYPISQALSKFKDHAHMQFLPVLAGCLLQLQKPNVQAIVPMPLSTEKLIERGFSQTHLLAQTLSKHWKLPIWQPLARHHRHSQRGLDRAQRLENLEDVFYLENKLTQIYQRVLILDDVITTGTSIALLQNKLLDIGCKNVQSICLCNATIDKIND